MTTPQTAEQQLLNKILELCGAVTDMETQLQESKEQLAAVTKERDAYCMALRRVFTDSQSWKSACEIAENALPDQGGSRALPTGGPDVARALELLATARLRHTQGYPNIVDQFVEYAIEALAQPPAPTGPLAVRDEPPPEPVVDAVDTPVSENDIGNVQCFAHLLYLPTKHATPAVFAACKRWAAAVVRFHRQSDARDAWWRALCSAPTPSLPPLPAGWTWHPGPLAGCIWYTRTSNGARLFCDEDGTCNMDSDVPTTEVVAVLQHHIARQGSAT